MDARPWPTDPATGHRLTHRDLTFLDLTEAQIEWWRDRRAPLGMTPAQFSEFQSSLAEALAPYGLQPGDTRIQLVGSAVRGWSGWTKTLDNIEHTPRSRELLRHWLGDDSGPVHRPFDLMSKLGLGGPSDYDVSFHSDRMVEIVRAHWDAAGQPGEFAHRHGFVDGQLVEDNFPEVQDWRQHWAEQLGRKVGQRLFGRTKDPLQKRAQNSSRNDDAWPLDLTVTPPRSIEPGPHPTDPVNGYRLQPRDQTFLGYTDEQVTWWRCRVAPMGMTPSQFHDLRTSLHRALRQDQVSVEAVEVQLKGSGVNFFSNKRKLLPTPDGLVDHPAAAARLRDWLGDDPNRPRGRMFDSMYRLGLGDPSDIDLQIRSDTMVAAARRQFAARPPAGITSLADPKYHFVHKVFVEETFPALTSWALQWQTTLDRDVTAALFGLHRGPRQPGFDDPERAIRGWMIIGPDALPLGVRPPDRTLHRRRTSDAQVGLDAASPVVLQAPPRPRLPAPTPPTRPVVTEDGTWRWKGHVLEPVSSATVDDFLLLNRQAGHGPGGIRERLIEVQQRVTGATLAGLDQDLKSSDRLKEKIASRLATHRRADLRQVMHAISDSIRYTICFTATAYTSGVQLAATELRSANFQLVQAKNGWTSPELYQGINSHWRDTASGLLLEIQFHTPESWYVKNQVHDAYQQENNPLTSAVERTTWRSYQERYFRLVPLPDGVRTLNDRLTVVDGEPVGPVKFVSPEREQARSVQTPLSRSSAFVAFSGRASAGEAVQSRVTPSTGARGRIGSPPGRPGSSVDPPHDRG